MRILLIVFLSSALLSCSTARKDKREIHEAAAASQVTDSTSLGRTIQEHIDNSKTLSPEQKAELREIVAANKKRAQELTEESYKYRGVLVEELLSGKASKNRIRILEKNIERIENLRLKNTFETVKKVSAIVKGQPDKSEFADELINIDTRGTSKR